MKKTKSLRKRLILENDKLFREIIRARDKVCQKTSKVCNLQVCHFWRRNILRTRWDLDNACLLTGGIHFYWAHSHFQDFQAFWLKRLGKDRYDKLELKARYVLPVRMEDLLFTHYELKKKYSNLQGQNKINLRRDVYVEV